MKATNPGWLITAVIILGVHWIRITTIQDGRRILTRGERQDQDAFPYYGREHGEDDDTPLAVLAQTAMPKTLDARSGWHIF